MSCFFFDGVEHSLANFYLLFSLCLYAVHVQHLVLSESKPLKKIIRFEKCSCDGNQSSFSPQSTTCFDASLQNLSQAIAVCFKKVKSMRSNLHETNNRFTNIVYSSVVLSEIHSIQNQQSALLVSDCLQSVQSSQSAQS